MSENELRIGNYYKWYADGKYYYFKVDNDTFSDYNVLNNMQPIELTEEILLKCGFVKDEFDNWENETRLGLYKPEEFDGYLSIWGDSTVGECNYLHQLQNLYWCLCGKEIWKLTNEELKVK